MVKQTRKKFRRPKRKSFRKKTSKIGRSYKKMVGGDFTQEETEQLLGLGFSKDDIQVLSNTGVRLNIIQMSLNEINSATGAPFTPQEIIQSVNEANDEFENFNEDISVPDQENGVADINGNGMNHIEEQPPLLNIEELGTYSPRSVTEMGGKRRKGKKGRKTRKGKKGRITAKKRKQRGGICFGNGVGANNYDPNFSIYNTRELTLFPYKPTN
jgi:hypothetical protein